MKKLSLLATLLASSLLVACGAANEESKPEASSAETPTSSAVVESSAEAPASSEAPAEAEVFFSWTAAGTCTLDFYADCTYKFAFPSYKVEEKGTWSFQSWSMKVTTPNGNEIAATIDGTTHDMALDYVADVNAALHDSFTVSSSVWGPKLGATGTYTPAA